MDDVLDGGAPIVVAKSANCGMILSFVKAGLHSVVLLT